MKRFWITLLTVAMALVIALPAGAVKPPKPPKPTTSAPISVYLDVAPMWVHEVADTVYFKVVVQNKTNSPVSIESADLRLSYGDAVSNLFDVGLMAMDRVVPAFDSVTLEYSAWPEPVEYSSLRQSVASVIPSGVFPPNRATDPEDLIGTATVTYFYDRVGDGGTVASQTTALVMPYGPYGDCGFEGSTTTMSVERTDSEICIWTPEVRGIWEVSMLPSVERPTNVTVTMRDHVPGNWCTLPSDPDDPLEDVGGIIKGRWKPGSPAMTGEVYLPGATPLESFGDISGEIPWWMWITDGTCLSGGAGGDFFQVGNPESFYLWVSVPGDVTVTHQES